MHLRRQTEVFSGIDEKYYYMRMPPTHTCVRMRIRMCFHVNENFQRFEVGNRRNYFFCLNSIQLIQSISIYYLYQIFPVSSSRNCQ